MLSEFDGLRVLVVGDVMLDRYWFGDVDRISPEAPVPVVSIRSCEERAGGAANVARNVAAFGGVCTVMSVIGKDEAGASLRKILDDDEIHHRLYNDDKVTTTIKLRIISQNQQLLRADFEKPPSYEVLAQCLDDYRSMLSDNDVVVLSDYGKGGLYHVAVMIEAARDAGIPIIVDPKGTDFSRYRGATMITPNQREFEAVVGTYNDEKELQIKAQRLARSLDIEELLITKSGAGMSLYRGSGEVSHSPARALEVYDVSGAGDTVIAAMAMAKAARLGDDAAMNIANAAAGVVVSKLGTAVPSRAEIQSLISIGEIR